MLEGEFILQRKYLLFFDIENVSKTIIIIVADFKLLLIINKSFLINPNIIFFHLIINIISSSNVILSIE